MWPYTKGAGDWSLTIVIRTKLSMIHAIVRKDRPSSSWRGQLAKVRHGLRCYPVWHYLNEIMVILVMLDSVIRHDCVTTFPWAAEDVAKSRRSSLEHDSS